MRKPLSAYCLALSALCALTLFVLPAHGQDKDKKEEGGGHPNGIVHDWSRHQLVYPRFGPIDALIGAQRDPRAILSWQEESRRDWNRWNHGRHPHDVTEPGVHRDWSISLGSGSTAASMLPAKFGLDTTANPTCSDFAVFPVSVAGSTTQPNLVAFSNLYSGGSKVITGSTNSTTTVTITAGTVTQADVGQAITGTGIPALDTIASVTGTPGTSLTLTSAATATNAGVAITIGTGTAGFCTSRTPQGTIDNILQATTAWSYNITGVGGGGIVSTSPALSEDGNKIAFVETGGGAAHLHVLAWRNGDGVNTNAQDVLTPASITSGFSATAPAAGSGAVTDLSFGSANDTLSSPFVDYNTDTVYVGNDAGVLFRFKNVFCTTAACTGGGSPVPILDTSWNSTGSVALGSCTGMVTGAVEDSHTGNIFAGCSDGKLYGFTPAGAAIAGSPISVGDGTATGGIVDPPMIDAVFGFVYVVSGSNGAGSSVLVQASTASFSSPAPVIATLGAGAAHRLHAPAFNNAYYSSATSTNWLIYDWAVNGTGNITLYGVTFGAGHAMTSGAAANSFAVTGSTSVELSPVTEFLNGATDQLFVSGLINASPNFIEENITAFPSTITTSTAEGSGTSGIVVDNDSADPQASSIYFGVLSPGGNANSAVKLTQSGLD